MKKILFHFIIIVVYVITPVRCSKVGQVASKGVKMVDDLLPSAVTSILKSETKALVNDLKDGAQAVKKMLDDKVIPISQLPLYTYRAENKIYTLSALKRHGDKFVGAKIVPGTSLQKFAEFYGFFDMIDVKHVICEFFYNSADIFFYRGRGNFHKDILEEVEKLGVLKPEDIKTLEELGFKKKGQAVSTWYWSKKYEKFVPLMGELIGKEGEGKGYKLLSKEQVAIKKKYYELTDDIATLVWHLFFTYQDEHFPRENIVHRHLKRQQIEGHLMGNAFVFGMLNDTIKFFRVKHMYLGSDPLDTDKLKKEIKSFVKKLGKIYTSGKVDPFEEKTLIQKVVQYILRKLGIIKVDTDLNAMYKFKLEVLVVISKMLERADLDEEKAKEIIELCINHWKIVFYLHVSGTMTSTKPAPKFYNHNETEEEENSAITSDSDTMENDKSSSFESFKTTDSEELNDISEFRDKILEEKDLIAKRMEDKNPFRDLFKRCLRKADLNMKRIRETLIRTFQTICKYLLLKNEDCAFIKRSIRNINTYKLKLGGRIASRKYCNKHENECRKIGPNDYMLLIRKMTEIQGVSMAIVEYLILQCEEKKPLDVLSQDQKVKLRDDIRTLFDDNFYLRIFVTKEYRRALTDYAKGKKDSNIAKLAEQRADQIKKGVNLMPKKPPEMDPHDMDDVLIADNE